mmetsp:Transcript_8097/g.11381  ORF Transcript_8097/g.11381 Transcript_8097/m.11381 type:complete len:117 (+) Transcript_8097:1560-1910(+)
MHGILYSTYSAFNPSILHSIYANPHTTLTDTQNKYSQNYFSYYLQLALISSFAYLSMMDLTLLSCCSAVGGSGEPLANDFNKLSIIDLSGFLMMEMMLEYNLSTISGVNMGSLKLT